MKVLHVNTHINIGGISNYIVSLSKALKTNGVYCVVATSLPAGRQAAERSLEPELKKQGIKHFAIDINTKFEFGPKVFRAAPVLTKLIENEKIDIIHAHTRVSQVASLIASRRTKIPFVSTCHGHFKPRLSRKIFDTWGEKVIAISDAVKGHLEKDFGIDEKRIELIYSGVDTARFANKYSAEDISRAKRSLRLKEGPVVGTFGRLSSVKGQKYLIEAMKVIYAKRNDSQCLIIGSGPEESDLKNLSRSLGLENMIVFLNATYDNIPLYLSCTDVFVMPSLEEGLGLSLLEALASGRACVASDTGGIRDIIKDGVNGLLVPVGDAGAIAGAVLKLLGDSLLAEDMGLKGKGLVRDRFSLDIMADKMKKLYERVINERN